MKSKLYILPFLLLLACSLLLSSCKKWLPENRIVGTWKLVEVQKRRLVFDNDDIANKYSSGLFVFHEDGSAMYSDSQGQMNGSWDMHGRNVDGELEFTVHLYDFAANRSIDWDFDRIDFRKSGDKLFAYIQHSTYDYRFDFRKQ